MSILSNIQSTWSNVQNWIGASLTPSSQQNTITTTSSYTPDATDAYGQGVSTAFPEQYPSSTTTPSVTPPSSFGFTPMTQQQSISAWQQSVGFTPPSTPTLDIQATLPQSMAPGVSPPYAPNIPTGATQLGESYYRQYQTPQGQPFIGEKISQADYMKTLPFKEQADIYAKETSEVLSPLLFQPFSFAGERIGEATEKVRTAMRGEELGYKGLEELRYEDLRQEGQDLLDEYKQSQTTPTRKMRRGSGGILIGEATALMKNLWGDYPYSKEKLTIVGDYEFKKEVDKLLQQQRDRDAGVYKTGEELNTLTNKILEIEGTEANKQLIETRDSSLNKLNTYIDTGQLEYNKETNEIIIGDDTSEEVNTALDEYLSSTESLEKNNPNLDKLRKEQEKLSEEFKGEAQTAGLDKLWESEDYTGPFSVKYKKEKYKKGFTPYKGGLTTSRSSPLVTIPAEFIGVGGDIAEFVGKEFIETPGKWTITNLPTIVDKTGKLIKKTHPFHPDYEEGYGTEVALKTLGSAGAFGSAFLENIDIATGSHVFPRVERGIERSLETMFGWDTEIDLPTGTKFTDAIGTFTPEKFKQDWDKTGEPDFTSAAMAGEVVGAGAGTELEAAKFWQWHKKPPEEVARGLWAWGLMGRPLVKSGVRAILLKSRLRFSGLFKTKISKGVDKIIIDTPRSGGYRNFEKKRNHPWKEGDTRVEYTFDTIKGTKLTNEYKIKKGKLELISSTTEKLTPAELTIQRKELIRKYKDHSELRTDETLKAETPIRDDYISGHIKVTERQRIKYKTGPITEMIAGRLPPQVVPFKLPKKKLTKDWIIEEPVPKKKIVKEDLYDTIKFEELGFGPGKELSAQIFKGEKAIISKVQSVPGLTPKPGPVKTRFRVEATQEGMITRMNVAMKKRLPQMIKLTKSERSLGSWKITPHFDPVTGKLIYVEYYLKPGIKTSVRITKRGEVRIEGIKKLTKKEGGGQIEVDIGRKGKYVDSPLELFEGRIVEKGPWIVKGEKFLELQKQLFKSKKGELELGTREVLAKEVPGLTGPKFGLDLEQISGKIMKGARGSKDLTRIRATSFDLGRDLEEEQESRTRLGIKSLQEQKSISAQEKEQEMERILERETLREIAREKLKEKAITQTVSKSMLETLGATELMPRITTSSTPRIKTPSTPKIKPPKWVPLLRKEEPYKYEKKKKKKKKTLGRYAPSLGGLLTGKVIKGPPQIITGVSMRYGKRKFDKQLKRTIGL